MMMFRSLIWVVEDGEVVVEALSNVAVEAAAGEMEGVRGRRKHRPLMHQRAQRMQDSQELTIGEVDGVVTGDFTLISGESVRW